MKILVVVIAFGLSAVSYGGSGDDNSQSSTKLEVHIAVGEGSQSAKATFAQLATAVSSSDSAVRKFFSRVVPEFQNQKLIIRTGMDKPIYSKEGQLIFTVSNGLCYDERDGRSYAVFVKPLTSVNQKPDEVDICLSEAKLAHVKPTELHRQVMALLAFGVAISHNYNLVDATKVQAYVLEKVQ